MPPNRPLWVALALVHLALLLALLGDVAGEAKPVDMPGAPLTQDGAAQKLRCLSYAPFHLRGQTPFDETLIIPRQQIEEDLRALSAMTGCVRTYSVDAALAQVPAIAQELGLKVLLGAWIGFDSEKNAAGITQAVALAKAYPDTVRAIIVGNEVLLRRERSAQEMQALLDSARADSPVPITYADVWEFWLKHPELAAHVDFVTVHILPFWEDEPVSVELALQHVAETRAKVGAAFADKPILIGETGWPSAGRQRGESRPSLLNQARYIREFAERARLEGWDYNLIEAIDQPWKRALEGTVGGHWGVLDAGSLQPKFPLSGAVSERDGLYAPILGSLAGAFLALCLTLAGRARSAIRHPLRLAALVLIGASTGLVAVLHAEHALQSYASLTDWIALGAVALVSPAAAVLLTRWDAQTLRPADLAWQRMRQMGRGFDIADALAALRGFLLFAASIASLLLFVDPRYRDFPIWLYLTPAAVYGVIGWQRGSRYSRAERLCAALIAACALGRWFPEPGNPQALAWLLSCLVLSLPVLVRPRFCA